MRAQNVNKAQQLKYIFECRNSGLTDYQWCNEHGIHPGTFYNWVSKLKKAGYQDPVLSESEYLSETEESISGLAAIRYNQKKAEGQAVYLTDDYRDN